MQSPTPATHPIGCFETPLSGTPFCTKLPMKPCTLQAWACRYFVPYIYLFILKKMNEFDSRVQEILLFLQVYWSAHVDSIYSES